MELSLDREDLLALLRDFHRSPFVRFRLALGPMGIAVDRGAMRRDGPDGVIATVASPSLGTFEARLRQDASPFVECGSEVRSDTAIGTVRVLDRRTVVEAGIGGTVVEVFVRDGDFVEFGQPLIRVRRRAAGASVASAAG